MSLRALYAQGSAAMGAPLFDAQITRAEAMTDKAVGAIKGVKGALVANAVVTGASTVILVASALRARKGGRRG